MILQGKGNHQHESIQSWMCSQGKKGFWQMLDRTTHVQP